jgi:hypothetical protein
MNAIARFLACASILACGTVAHAEIVTYEFTGTTYVGGSARTFTGIFEFEAPTPCSTVYYNGTGTIQGFVTQYPGAVRTLSITLDDDESVSAAPGYIQINNIIQAEAGAPVPQGLSLQAYGGSAGGTINGQFISFLYLAFLPVNPNFNWDPLDALFDGNAENMLDANPSILSPYIDPVLTGTELPIDLPQKFSGGLFLGTVHATNQGVITTVNTISTFTRVTITQCPADLDDGQGDGTQDGGVDINDLLYFLSKFEDGNAAADLDDGSNTGTQDGGVDINDLLFFLVHFEAGC